ncbi:MAG: hypothetical protein FJ134_15260 [Deltaproteobacteria bacterium]|nr:hypothetical protein [Deltaproteobacteria bacterium]
MNVSRKTLFLSLLLAILFWVEAAGAGESGRIFCTAPGCGFEDKFTIGGGMKSPSVTGYCTHGHGFVRVKLRHWNEYYHTHFCPVCHKAVKPIYAGSQVSPFPCPKCGQVTLKYQRRYMFD